MKTNKKVYMKEKIMIGNLEWTIFLCDKNNYNLFDKDEITNKYKTDVNIDEGSFGITKFEHNEIYIHKDMSKNMIKRTLIHELTHAFLFTFGMMADETKLDEERICTFNEEHLEDIYKTANSVFKTIKLTLA